jgi:hypothetical protein
MGFPIGAEEFPTRQASGIAGTFASPLQAEQGDVQTIRHRLGTAPHGEPNVARQIHLPQAPADRGRSREQFCQLLAGLSAQVSVQLAGGQSDIGGCVSGQRRHRVLGIVQLRGLRKIG